MRPHPLILNSINASTSFYLRKYLQLPWEASAKMCGLYTLAIYYIKRFCQWYELLSCALNNYFYELYQE